jgi:hypothetical protein
MTPGDSQSDVQQNIRELINKMKVIEDDIKNAVVDKNGKITDRTDRKIVSNDL